MLFSLSLLSLFQAYVLGAPLSDAPSEPNRVLINSTLFPILTRYAHYASASYTVPCPRPPYGASVVKYINIKNTSTQATVFKIPEFQQIVLAFPGTASKKDEETDLNYNLTTLIAPGVNNKTCVDCKVHHGALIAYNSAAQAVEEQLTDLMKEDPHYRFIITGHSLGGSLSTIAYASLRGLDYPIEAVYTYGSPRVGNPQFAAHIDGLASATLTAPGTFYRSTHNNDSVPQLPPTFLGYYHTLTEYFEAAIGNETETKQTTYRCYGPENQACSAGHANPFYGSGHGYYANVYMGTGQSCGI